MERFDNSKQFLLKTLLLNNRLDTYGRYLHLAKSQGYRVLNMKDFFELPDRRDGKHFILRHDVDAMGDCTRQMFEIEKKCGVTSTYYFRFSTVDLPLIHEMHENGFEVGLHFETIADYVKENCIKDKSELDLELLRNRLAEDIKRFENMIGFKTTSCCSHGAQENVSLNISNNALTEDQDMARFGVDFEAYDAEMYNHSVDCHIMDNAILYNYGFSYSDNPIDAISEEIQNIVFLAHPSHWSLSAKSRFRKFGAFLLGRATCSTDRRFKRINK